MAKEETSMRRARGLIILCLLMGIVAVIYFNLGREPKVNEDTTVQVKKQLITLNKQDIKEISIIKNKSILRLNKVDNLWVVEGKDYSIEQAIADSIAYYVSALYPDKKIEGAAELDQYGLAHPQSVVKVVTSDNAVKEILVGDKSPVNTGYYLKVKGTEEVYLVPNIIGERFTITLENIRNRRLPEMDESGLTYIRVKKKDANPIELVYNEQQTENDKIYGLNTWKMVSPYATTVFVDEGRLDSLKAALVDMEISTFVEDNVKNFSKYGLDDPVLEVNLKDKDNDVTLRFGNFIGDDVYFGFDNDKNVYTVSKDMYEKFSINAYDIIQKFSFIENIYNIERVLIEAEGKSYALDLVKLPQKDGQKEQYSLRCKLNEKEITEKEGRYLYQALIGITVEGEIQNRAANVPVVKVTFYLNSNGKKSEVHINYMEYDKNFYAISRDGNVDFIISKYQINSLIEHIEAFSE